MKQWHVQDGGMYEKEKKMFTTPPYIWCQMPDEIACNNVHDDNVRDDGWSSDMCKMVACKEKEEIFTTPPYAWYQMTDEWHAIN